MNYLVDFQFRPIPQTVSLPHKNINHETSK